MKHALAALCMILAWDLLKPRRGTSRPNPPGARRRRMRAFHTCLPDGTLREFPDYPSFKTFCRQQRETEIFNRGKGTGMQETFQSVESLLFTCCAQVPPTNIFPQNVSPQYDVVWKKGYFAGVNVALEQVNTLRHLSEDKPALTAEPQESGTNEASSTAHARSKPEETIL